MKLATASTMAVYRDFLHSKSQRGEEAGFRAISLPESLLDFQKLLVEWAIRNGRAAIFADCGLGKTLMQLVWADNVVRHTAGNVLILTPLAVAAQTVREGQKFGIEAVISRNGRHAGNITVTNYEQIGHFDPGDYQGVVCDESSVLKNFAGVRRKEIQGFLRTIRYRLLCTATAAPNDYAELGTSSEALGRLGHMDMLSRFFKQNDNTLHKHVTKHAFDPEARWFFKAHAEREFWRWVCSWSRACRRPSDLGCDDSGFDLPPLELSQHVVKPRRMRAGMLFDVPARTLDEQREESRRTTNERCEAVAEYANGSDAPFVAWCQSNSESQVLSRLLADAVEVTGSDPVERKEEVFSAFAAKQIKALVTKPKIGGFGMNWQHCARMSFFPSHSFEQYYQSLRRCWRFGQQQPVHVRMITTEGQASVLGNLRRKAEAAEKMFTDLVAMMHDALSLRPSEYGDKQEIIAPWL